MANVCLPNTKKLGEGILEWAEKAHVKKTFVNPYDAAFKLVESEFLMALPELSGRDVDITQGQLRSYKARLDALDGYIRDGSLGSSSKFAQFFWQSSHYGKKDPVVGAVLRNMQMSNFHFRRHEAADKHLMQGMFENIEKEALSLGIVTKTGLKFKTAQKEMQKLDSQLKEAIFKYESGDIKISEVSKISRKIDSLVGETYLKVYENLRTIIEDQIPQLEKQKFDKASSKEKEEYRKGNRTIKLTKTDMLQLKDNNGQPLSGNMHKAVLAYTDLMGSLYNRLRLGVDARIDSILGRMSHKDDSLTIHKLKEIREKLRGKLMPKYEGAGFFPHYTRDLSVNFLQGLMPHLDAMQTSANPYLKGEQSLTNVLDAMSNYISGHTKHRASGGEYEYSKNFMSSVTTYINDVNRFNYAAFMDKHMMEGLTSVEKIYKLDGAAHGYGQSVVDYIQDLHQATNGDINISPKTRALMRAVLGMEFISKLGINPRGAARNWTQRLLDYVEWGPVQVWKTKQILDKFNIGESTIEAELKKVGLLYEDISPELMESEVVSGSPSRELSFDESTQKHVFVKKSVIEKVADKIGWVAGKSSYLHRRAENSNRKHTFKIAFAQMYDWLNNPKYKEQLLKNKPNSTDAQIDAKIKLKARQYAVNMVVLNHFDYAQYAKSKALRSKVGRFLGQFQHYSFEFFDRNMKIAREAKYDLMSGKILPGQDAQGLSKAYRMGIAYFMGPAIASALMGVDFSNIIEHDTATRLKQLAVALTGDDDEIKEAFYGKGPIISTFGGPITSDLLDIGMMLDLINLDDDSIIAMYAGLEKYDPSTHGTDTTRKLRLLNSFLGRLTERHIPQLKEGRIGWAFQQEFGLYPTAEARKKQRVMKKARKAILPEGVEDVLTKMEAGKL